MCTCVLVAHGYVRRRSDAHHTAESAALAHQPTNGQGRRVPGPPSQSHRYVLLLLGGIIPAPPWLWRPCGCRSQPSVSHDDTKQQRGRVREMARHDGRPSPRIHGHQWPGTPARARTRSGSPGSQLFTHSGSAISVAVAWPGVCHRCSCFDICTSLPTTVGVTTQCWLSASVCTHVLHEHTIDYYLSINRHLVIRRNSCCLRWHARPHVMIVLFITMV